MEHLCAHYLNNGNYVRKIQLQCWILFDLSGSKLLFWPGSDKLFSLHNIENIWIMFLIFYKLFSFLIFYKLFSFLTMIVASCRSPILSTPLSSSDPHLKERALAMGVRPILVTQAVTTLCTLHL